VRVSKRVIEIARRAGFDPLQDFKLPQVSDVVASRIISYGIHPSLAYGRRRYREGEARERLAALRELGASAEFWANQHHADFSDRPPVEGYGNTPGLTEATFEAGVIGAKANTGFIWWRTEEDEWVEQGQVAGFREALPDHRRHDEGKLLNGQAVRNITTTRL
jgi:hypothetical protein